MAITALPLGITVIFLICALVIVLQNLFIWFLIYKNKKLRTYTNAILISLGFSDFLFGSAILPCYVVLQSEVNGYLIAIVLNANTANILIISIERFIAILKPLHYRYYIGVYWYWGIIAAWVIPIITSLIPVFWKKNDQEFKVYVVCLMIFHTIIPYIAVIIMHFLMFREMRARPKIFGKCDSSQLRISKRHKENNRIKLEWQVAKVSSLLAAVFLAAWLPLGVLTICMVLDTHIGWLSIFSMFTLTLHSVVNTHLYAFMKRDFKDILYAFLNSIKNHWRQPNQWLLNPNQSVRRGDTTIEDKSVGTTGDYSRKEEKELCQRITQV